MAVFRDINRKQFTCISQSAIRDERLSLKALGLLVALLALPDDWHFSERGLASIFKHDGQTSLRTALQELERTGYLKRRKVKDPKSGKFTNVIWDLYENPRLENPNMDIPNEEKPQQSNTIKSITKEQNNIKQIDVNPFAKYL